MSTRFPQRRLKAPREMHITVVFPFALQHYQSVHQNLPEIREVDLSGTPDATNLMKEKLSNASNSHVYLLCAYEASNRMSTDDRNYGNARRHIKRLCDRDFGLLCEFRFGRILLELCTSRARKIDCLFHESALCSLFYEAALQGQPLMQAQL